MRRHLSNYTKGLWKGTSLRRAAVGIDNLIERVFIASGLPFVGASAADIADGLRKDVERLREWRRERLGDGSPAHHP